MPQTPLGSAAFAAGVGFTTKRTTLEDFLDPPLEGEVGEIHEDHSSSFLGTGVYRLHLHAHPVHTHIHTHTVPT